jgi:hypothetical protein
MQGQQKPGQVNVALGKRLKRTVCDTIIYLKRREFMRNKQVTILFFLSLFIVKFSLAQVRMVTN